MGTTRILVACLLAGGVVAGSAQSAQVLGALTVPASALPGYCALTPPPAPDPPPVTRGGVTVIHPGPRSQYPTNPWAGTEWKIVAAIHQAVDGGTRGAALPDVPPMSPGDMATAQQKWADNVLEAYHAAYAAADGYQVEVFAVRFNDATLAARPEPLSAVLNPPRGLTHRIVRGATAIRVSAPADTATTCFAAVRTYLESLK